MDPGSSEEHSRAETTALQIVDWNVRRWWQVTFRGIVSRDAEAALKAVGIVRDPAASDDRQAAAVWLLATDDMDAIHQVSEALRPFEKVTAFTARPFNWLFYVGVLGSEAAAFDTDDARADDPRPNGVITSVPSQGAAEVVIQFAADDQDDANWQVRQAYAAWRSRAGLPPAEPLYGFSSSPGPWEPKEQERLRVTAQRLFETGDYDNAIIASQTMCEVTVRGCLEKLVKAVDPDNEPRLSKLAAKSWKSTHSHSLTDDRICNLWNALAQDDVRQQEWWPEYVRHTVRRHGVIHQATQASKPEAEDSLAATTAFCRHVTAKYRAVPRTTGS